MPSINTARQGKRRRLRGSGLLLGERRLIRCTPVSRERRQQTCPVPGWAMVGSIPHQLDRWMYKGGRPNAVARFLNGLWGRMAVSGRAPQQLFCLEVPGRRSGRRILLPVVVADHEGRRYLVAMLGEGANWVANVRAAGGRAVLRRGRSESIHLVEVDDPRTALRSSSATSNRPPALARTSRSIRRRRSAISSGSPPTTRSS